jgi:predicted extracellular nuclease
LTLPFLSALTSSFVGNYAYRVTGVVTAISEWGDRFWFQDTEGDGDPSTSDGALVDTFFVGAVGTLDPSADPVVYTPLAVGDIVTLTKAKVFEDQFFDEGSAEPLLSMHG